MEFQEHTIRARRHGGFGDYRHAISPASGRRSAGARIRAGQLHGMCGIDSDRHTEALHFSDTEHIDHQIIVAEGIAPLA
jgi:hypothetical protein